MRNKIAIYTCLYGCYDKLMSPKIIDKNFDYLCFTDNMQFQSKIWSTRTFNQSNFDSIYSSRYPKILPHIFLSDYEYSLYMDANMVISSQAFYDEIRQKISQNKLWVAFDHPTRNCIYKEAEEVVLLGKADKKNVDMAIDELRKENYPRNFGLVENNVILRKHNVEIIKKIDAEWWELFTKHQTCRDQLSLYYLFWKNNFTPDLFFNGRKLWSHPEIIRRNHILKENSSLSFLDKLRNKVYPLFK